MREKIIAQQAKIDLEAQRGEVLVSGGNDPTTPSLTIFLRGVTWLAGKPEIVISSAAQMVKE